MGRIADMSRPSPRRFEPWGRIEVRPHVFQLCAGIRRPRRYRVD